MTVRIERAQREHALILGALTLQADLESGGTRRNGFLTEYADAWLADFDAMPTWIAFSTDGSAIGFVQTSLVHKLPSLCRPTTSWLHVKNVFVTQSARGNGIAERLLRTMVVWGDKHDIERYQLNAEPKARSSYERMGFGAPDDRLMVRRGSTTPRT